MPRVNWRRAKRTLVDSHEWFPFVVGISTLVSQFQHYIIEIDLFQHGSQVKKNTKHKTQQPSFD